MVIACVKAEALCKWDEHVTILIQRERAARAWGGVGSRAAAKGAKAPGDGVTMVPGSRRATVATAEFLKRRNAIYQRKGAICSPDASLAEPVSFASSLQGGEFPRQIYC